MDLYAFVFAAMRLLSPSPSTEIASAIAQVVADEPPLFRGDDDKRKTAGLIVAVAFRESSFRNDVASGTNDHCLMQVHDRPELASDVVECVRVGIRMLRESMHVCASSPLAFYAEGPRGCSSERAQRISRDRLSLAQRLVARVQ